MFSMSKEENLPEIEEFCFGCSEILAKHLRKIAEEDGDSEFRKKFDKAWDEIIVKGRPERLRRKSAEEV